MVSVVPVLVVVSKLMVFEERLPPATGFKDFRAKSGTLSAPGETFCLWNTIKKYPQVYIGNANRERVAAKFFDHGALENRQWDL